MRLDVLRRELAQGAETIHGLVVGVSAAEARVRPEPAAWSILEVVAHLLDEEREDFRPRLDVVLHRPHETWAPIDPAAWVTARGYNDRELAATLSAFLAERERSLGRKRTNGSELAERGPALGRKRTNGSEIPERERSLA